LEENLAQEVKVLEILQNDLHNQEVLVFFFFLYKKKIKQ